MALTYRDIPTIEAWKKDSSVAMATRSKDAVLGRIDALVEACGKAEAAGDGGQWVYLACDLFMSLDYWLKVHTRNAAMEKKREPAVMALYKCVAEWLCVSFSCTVNVLPRELELYFGRELGFHGAKLDKAFDCAISLQRAEAKKYRLFFKDGKAFMFPWWKKSSRPGETKLVPADSKHAANPGVFDDGTGYRTGWGGFAMSMGRDIYMAKHHCTRARGENGNFYHSSYLGGDPVMCAGTMLIEDGVIKAISTDSGHYRPTQMHVVNLLQALQMRGVNIAAIDVQDHEGTVVAKANAFIQANGNWAAMLARRQANITHLASALHERSDFEDSIKKLWTQGVQGGTFRDDMAGRAHFASILQYYTRYSNGKSHKPFEGVSFLFVLEALARATSRAPDAWEKWIFESWTDYARDNRATDSQDGRKKFARWMRTGPDLAGWSDDDVVDLLKKAYESRRLPWR